MESGRAEVRDITEDIMDMRARAAATAGTPMNPFAGLAMPSPAASTPIAVGPLGPENPGGSMYSTPAGMGSFGVGRGGRWRDAGSDGILSKMYGERQAMSSLMSNYSSWLKVTCRLGCSVHRGSYVCLGAGQD